MTVNGHSKDVSIASDGHVLEVEEEVISILLSPQVRWDWRPGRPPNYDRESRITHPEREDRGA